MRALKHYRLASADEGDDTTLTRYVRDDRGEETPHKHHQPRLPGLEATFVQEGRTKFPKRVLPVASMPHLLVSGHCNVKIGRDVRKGKFRGYRIFTLSLEERKTCPTTCQHWQTCYGNNMPFAKRIDHTDPEFLSTLETEIAALLQKYPEGILIRLHALGDFYSVEYVGFWRKMLEAHGRLAIFGYTARRPGLLSAIGNSISTLNVHFPDRCMIRFSNGGLERMSTVTIFDETSRPANAFICPEQTGKTRCCATCGACWSTNKNVAFMEH